MARRVDLFIMTLLLTSFLTACASSVSPPSRYMLPGVSPTGAPASPQTQIKVNLPRLAHYLDVDGIVFQLDDIEMREAREHQWADTLASQLEKNLRGGLAQALPTIRFSRADGPSDEILSLHLDVDEFQGRYDGYAVASGQWQLRDRNRKLVHLDSFHARTALSNDGYPALVRALGKSWSDVAQDIARTLEQRGYTQTSQTQ
ncbi:PqiC family protein [Halomonas sp. LS-001]